MGLAGRNDSCITTSLITAQKYDEAAKTVPAKICMDRREAEKYRNRYVDYPVLREGKTALKKRLFSLGLDDSGIDRS